MNKLLTWTSAIALIFSANGLSGDGVNQLQEKFTKDVHTPGAIVFTPPKNWKLADPTDELPHISIMVIGKGAHELPPSLYLMSESFNGSVNDYLHMIKQINLSKGSEWKDLGKIRTEAGEGNLSQVDMRTEWGDVRMMHVVIVRDETAHVLTAAALKKEFPRFYKDFFSSLRSLRINS